MRNPYRTNRKPSYKPLSKKKLRRYNGYDTLDEELFEAQLAMQKWFIGYMEALRKISELKTRAWLVSAAPPAKLQYFSGEIDGVSGFDCDWRRGIPFTYSESQRVKVELEQAFSKRNEQYEVVWLGDVGELGVRS